MSKFYIAARYSRRLELVSLVERLEAQGHVSTARWIRGGEDKKDIEAAASMDVADVVDCDTLIFIGEPQGSEVRGGGRWFEFGLAYALDKRCIVVLNLEVLPNLGDRIHLPLGHETVFTALPDLLIVNSIEEIEENL